MLRKIGVFYRFLEPEVDFNFDRLIHSLTVCISVVADVGSYYRLYIVCAQHGHYYRKVVNLFQRMKVPYRRVGEAC